jgi:hypothetical protein
VEYAEVVRDSLASNSDACVASVQKATAALEGLVTTTDGRAKLTKQFKSVLADYDCYCFEISCCLQLMLRLGQ